MLLLQESYQLWSRWSSYSGALVQVEIQLGKVQKIPEFCNLSRIQNRKQHFINLGHDKRAEKKGILFKIGYLTNWLLFSWIATGVLLICFSVHST